VTKDKITGFSLIEAMIAIILLTLILVGGMAYFFYANDSLKVANYRRIAAEIAQSSMEQIKSANYTTLQSSFDSNVTIGTLTGNRTISVSNQIQDADGSVYKQVTVNLTWDQPNKSVPGQVVLDTYIAPK